MSQQPPTEPRIRVLVVDDHSITRKGIGIVLEDCDDIALVYEAETGEQALDLLRKYDGAIDVVLMDIDMPGQSGITTTRHLTKQWPRCGVVLLTGFTKLSEAAFTCGARGYVLKDAEDHEIVAAVRSVSAGKTFISPKVQSNLMDLLQEPLEPLTSREYEILTDLREGFSNARIAANQGLSENTVREYVSSILKKLGAENRTQAVVLALRRGLLK